MYVLNLNILKITTIKSFCKTMKIDLLLVERPHRVDPTLKNIYICVITVAEIEINQSSYTRQIKSQTPTRLKKCLCDSQAMVNVSYDFSKRHFALPNTQMEILSFKCKINVVHHRSSQAQVYSITPSSVVVVDFKLGLSLESYEICKRDVI